MAMFGTSSKMILIAFMLVSVSTLSTGHKISDKDLKLLCSKTGHLGGCYKLLKSDHRTANVDEKGLVEVSIDLASNNAKKIHSMFNSLAKTARDSRLRNAYYLCSKNYNDAIRNLEVAKNDLHTNAYKNIDIQVKDAFEEVKNCKEVFSGESNDHTQIKKNNQNFEFLLNIVKVTFDNVNKK